MSDVAEAISVSLILADYAAVDPMGKINMIGGQISLVGSGQGDSSMGQMPSTTVPFTVVVLMAVPPSLYDSIAAIEVVLEDAEGQLVQLPGLAPNSSVMRVAQNVSFDEPRFPPPMEVPRRTLPARAQWVLSFSNGLPLPLGQKYVWRVRVDHATKDEWTETMFVVGPAPGPVIG